MQTFLPYASYELSASSLDMRRLGKQRVETLQLLKSIEAIKNKTNYKGWKNHPCRSMWFASHKGDAGDYTNSLVKYGITICKEWKKRGYKDSCLEKIAAFSNPALSFEDPEWLGDEDFHMRHRSMLIQKKPEYYREKFAGTPENLEYTWPKA